MKHLLQDRFLLAPAIVTALSACANLNMQKPLEPEATADTSKAYLYGRFDEIKGALNFGGMAIRLQAVDSDETFEIPIKDGVFVFAVEPATYRLTDFLYVKSGPDALLLKSDVISTPIEPGPGPFTVKAGRAYYMGDFTGHSDHQWTLSNPNHLAMLLNALSLENEEFAAATIEVQEKYPALSSLHFGYADYENVHASAEQPEASQTVFLQFDWPLGMRARVDVTRLKVTERQEARDTISISASYLIAVEPHESGRLIRFSDYVFGSASSTALEGAGSAQSDFLPDFVARVGQLMPDFVVSVEGELIDVVGAEALVEVLVEELLTAGGLSEDSVEAAQARTMLEVFFSPDNVISNAADLWTALVYNWVGEEFDRGYVYEFESEVQAFPALGGGMVPAVGKLEVSNSIPCLEGEADARCVELSEITWIEDDALADFNLELRDAARETARRLDGLTNDVEIPEPDRPALTVSGIENEIVLIAEPETLIPYSLLVGQLIDLTYEEDGRKISSSELERTTYTFTYGDSLPLPGTQPPADVVFRAPMIPPTILHSEAAVSTGSENAPVIVLEFFDYLCSHCKVFEEGIGSWLRARYASRDDGAVRWVRVPFLLWPESVAPASATWCAGQQGKSENMHDLLFSRVDEWSVASDLRYELVRYAGVLDLDREAFQACLESDAPAMELSKIQAFGRGLGVSSTPTVFVDGEIVTPLTRQELLHRLERASSGVGDTAESVESVASLDASPHYIERDAEPVLENAALVRVYLDSEYPRQLRDDGIGGSVILWIFIDRDGTVARSEVHESSGYPELDLAALAVAEHMRFQPALLAGEPVGVWVAQEISFTVE